MLNHYRAIKEITSRIGSAVDSTVGALQEGRVEHEPAFTDRMLGSIEESLKDFRSKGIKWDAKTLTDRGRGSQESKVGADFLVTIEYNLDDYKVAKGFLAQAKLLRKGDIDSVKDLQEQCEKMLKLSPDSFVFLYDTESVRVVPAVSVISSDFSPTEHYSRAASRFFADHLECFVGDRNISSATPEGLEKLIEKYHARSALLIQAGTDPEFDGGNFYRSVEYGQNIPQAVRIKKLNEPKRLRSSLEESLMKGLEEKKALHQYLSNEPDN